MSKNSNLKYTIALATENGISLEHYADAYTEPVVSCKQAAEARGVHLSAELKHLLLQTCGGLCMAHLPADKQLSLGWAKSVLGVEEAFLADLSEHFESYPFVQPGTVSVLIEPFWSLPHLIDREIFERELMTTNDGTLFGYVLFDPQILRHTKNHTVEDFEAVREKNNKKRHRILAP